MQSCKKCRLAAVYQNYIDTNGSQYLSIIMVISPNEVTMTDNINTIMIVIIITIIITINLKVFILSIRSKPTHTQGPKTFLSWSDSAATLIIMMMIVDFFPDWNQFLIFVMTWTWAPHHQPRGKEMKDSMLRDFLKVMGV